MKNMLFIIYKTLFKLTGIFLPKKNTYIVFESFLGKQFSDNPRAIYEHIKKNHPEYKLYWSVDKNYITNFDATEINIIKRLSLKWMYIMNRSTYWVSNSRLPGWIPKPRNTIYLQTWHGTPLKKLGLDIEQVHMFSSDTKRYKCEFVNEAQKWDFLISPNQYSTKIFKQAFNFKNEIIETGYPRNDYLVLNNQEEYINSLKKKMNIPIGKRVILYAPTWRDNQFKSDGKYTFNLPFNMEKIYQELAKDHILIVRLHYLVSNTLELPVYAENFVYDFSDYEDIRDLYLISDLLVTDYSSVFFDYSILKRPILFYAYDLEDYRDKLRGFYFDFENNAPGPILKNTDELIYEIKSLDNSLNNNYNFLNKFHELEDGQATKRVFNIVFKS